MSDPTNWLHSTKKLCQVVIEKCEQRIAMPFKEEVTTTYPELHELMESIQLHHLKEDDIILIKGLQQHSETTTDGLQNSTEGVMCLSPSPSYNSSSVFHSLRKYALGFQHAIDAIIGNFPDTNSQSTDGTQHIPTNDISLPDANTSQRIKVPFPDVDTYLHHTSSSGVDISSLPSTDLPISEQSCQQNLVAQRLSSPVQLAEGIELPNVTTGIVVGTPSNAPFPSGSQFLEVLSYYAECMSNEILSTVIEDGAPQGIKTTMKQPEAWTSSEGHFASETVSHNVIPHSHLNQIFTGIDESINSSQDDLRTSRAIGAERNLEGSKDGREDAPHYDIDHLASSEASSIIQRSFQEVGIQMEETSADHISQLIIANSSGEAVSTVFPVVEKYALRLTQEVISDSTREASLGRKVTRNKLQQFEEETKNSQLAYVGSHKNKSSDLSEMSAMVLSQSDILTHELNHLTRTTVSSSCAGVRPLIDREQVENLTKESQQYLDGYSPDRERHLSASDKERSDYHDYEKLMFDKLGLTKKSSLDYPDAPPPTPLRPQLGSSQRSFTRKLKGGLAKEFLPSPPPPTPKETINFCLSEEDRDTEEKAEFMRKLMRSLSQEFNGKDTTGISEVPEEERLQNLELESLASKSEPTENSCTDEEKVQDYFSHLMSGIVFSSAQVICSIMGESIDPKAPKGQLYDSVTFSNGYQSNTQASEELNALSSDAVMLETERIPNEHNEDKHRASFPVRLEGLFWDYADKLAQKIIIAVTNFLNQIELLDHEEHNRDRKGEISSAENANKDCRHSHYIKQLNSISEEWVKEIVQSALQVFKTQYQLQQASDTNTVSLPQANSEFVHASEQLQNTDAAARSTDAQPFFIGANTEQHLSKNSLETMKFEASSQAEVLCSDSVFVERQNPVTQGSGCGIGISNIASPHEGTNDVNDSNLSCCYNPYPCKQPQIDVKIEEVTGKNLSCFVQAKTKMSLFEQKQERLCQHEDENAFLALNFEPIIDEEKSSTLELSEVMLKDPDHKPANKTYAENLAETILKSSLADACRNCSAGPVLKEVPTCSPKTDALYRKPLSVSDSSREQSPECQQKVQTEESFKDRGDGNPIILNTKSQRLNVVEYTGVTSSKQAQEDLNQSTVTLQWQAEEQEGCKEVQYSTSLAPREIELSLVNFNSKSVAIDAQVQAMLQWAAASQLNISKIHIRNSSEHFIGFPALLAQAEDEEWTVGGLLHAVLNFYERNQTADSPMLFDCLLEHPDSLHNIPHRISS
ncbi:A-kinase anchor protein 11 [Heterodontus francisci]|uniref:A-kinase anchor protein 11 n=1 Tax=Heterodontus francisci TaxID=7792 RepID=UPI00355B876F